MASSLHHFCEWLAATPVSNTIQEVAWIIPLTQTVHIVCIALLLASAAMLDLRLFGIAGRSDTVAATAKRLLPWIWGTLPILLVTGAVLTVAEPSRELENSTFVKKMILIVIAIAVTGLLQAALRRDPRLLGGFACAVARGQGAGGQFAGPVRGDRLRRTADRLHRPPLNRARRAACSFLTSGKSPMSIQALLEAIQASSVGTAIREGSGLFPIIECVHVLAITFVVGTIAMVDLRLLGFTSRQRAVTRLTSEILPYTWVGFVTAVITGSLLFSSAATKYFGNTAFRLKMLMLLLAGLNMLVFHLVTERTIKHWDEHPSPPISVKATGALSLIFWVGVVAAGRWIGFTDSGF